MPNHPSSDTARPSLLSLPLDIHILLFVYLSPSDIQKLRTLSQASYELFTSPAICTHYLSRHGIFVESPEDARAEFDRYFIPRDRIKKGKPTKATVVDGLRMTNSDAPYFTTSHAYQSGSGNVNKDGVVVYRTTAGDLALLDLSDHSKSSVLLITNTWEFTTQPLADYNKNGAGVAVIGGIRERISTGWWTAESFRDKGIGLKNFEVNVHHDFGGEVLFVELAWRKDEKMSSAYDVLALLQAAHTPLPPDDERSWYPIIARTKNLGLVISLNSTNFGHPIAALSLPSNIPPFAEYVLNSHYVAGIVSANKQFAYLRYARPDMETVCSLQVVKKEDQGSQMFWKIPEYLPPVIQINLANMGLSGFQTEHRLMFMSNMDIHVQLDRAGELAFVITGDGVTAFDIARVGQYGGLSAVKRYWWRNRDEMAVFIPSNEELEKEEIQRVGPWREGMWARSDYRSGCGRKVIAPSVPRIWKSFLPGKTYGGGDGDDEMFTIVRAYNYLRQMQEGETPRILPWQRPEFLVVWEIPLTRKGIEKYSAKTLNQKAGFGEIELDLKDWDPESKADLFRENMAGIYPSRVMPLQTAMTTNMAGEIRCFEPHWVFVTQIPPMIFARRDTYKTRPRWLTIHDSEIAVEGDEYLAIVGPLEKGKWKMVRQENGRMKIQMRDERALLKLDRDARLPCERPYPRTIQFKKKRSSFMNMLWGKGENFQISADKPDVVATGLEALPKGSIHHIKVGDSGNFVSYVIGVSPVPTPDFNRSGDSGGGPSGTLVVVRYD